MIENFTGRRPLSVRDYVVSIEGGPMLTKFGDFLCDGIRPMKNWT